MEIVKTILEFITFILVVAVAAVAYFGVPKYIAKKAENLATIGDIEKITKIVKKVEANFKYVEEKRKNLAIIEDIGKITEIVENIKSDLLRQNELLKAELSFKNQHRMNMKSAEREAILEFNKRVSAWAFLLIRFSFEGYDPSNYKKTKEVLLNSSTRQYECDLAEAQLEIFMYDKKFVECKKELIDSIHKIAKFVTKSIYKFLHEHRIYELFKKRKPLPPDFGEKTITFVRTLEKIKLEHDEIKELLWDFKNMQAKMMSIINKRLMELDESENIPA